MSELHWEPDVLFAGGYTTGETCPFCGELWAWDLFEVYPEERAFQVVACCGDAEEDLREDLSEALRTMGRDERKEYLSSLRRVFAGHGIELRTVASGDGRALLDFGIRLEPIDLKTAKAFVLDHHRHNRPPVSWRWGYGIHNGPDLVGVVMVGRPVARMIDGTTTVEVNRLCLAHDSIEGELLWNAASQAYAEAAREAKRRGFEKIITYTLETESGTSLRAAGWTPEARTKGGTWNRPSRARTDKAPTCRKTRWARELN